MEVLINNVKNSRESLTKLIAARDHLEKNVININHCIKRKKEEYQGGIQAREIIVGLAQKIQQGVKDRLSEIVTLGMSAVFDNPYSFRIEFVQRRNTVEADLIFTKDGNDYIDILESAGGGVADIASFCLRIGLWSLKKTDSVFILDEPFRNLSPTLHGSDVLS